METNGEREIIIMEEYEVVYPEHEDELIDSLIIDVEVWDVWYNLSNIRYDNNCSMYGNWNMVFCWFVEIILWIELNQ